MLKFYQITDLHYYPARELHACGEAWEKRAKYDQKCLAESEAIIDAAFAYLANDRDTDIVLITGDVVCDGELVGHRSLARKLKLLAESGKKIFLITASHDIRPDPKGYSEEKGEYVVECADNYGFSKDQLEWAQTQIDAAKAAGDRMLAVCHHPLLPPAKLYKAFSPFEMIDDSENVAAFLADNGIQLLFTGHTHMQSINYFDSPAGNRLYEINTACLTAYPSPIRKMELQDDALKVTTKHLETIDYDLQAKPYMLYLKEHFDFMLNDILDAAAHDIDRFCELGESFSLKKEKSEKFKVPLHMLGRLLDRLTFKRAGRLLGVLPKSAPRRSDVRIRALVLTLVNNLYGGTRNFAPGSAEYDAFMAVADRLFQIAPAGSLKEMYKTTLRPVLSDILYNANGLDSNDTLIAL